MPFEEKSDISLIWQACCEEVRPGLLGGTLFRIVENQEQIATRRLVDGDLDQLEVLEHLLESAKPPRVPGTELMHYLLATPWRYPPLRYGSRFGRRHEPSLFYGGTSLDVTLAEGAYYRCVLFQDMSVPPAKPIASQHTIYQAEYRTESGLQLQRPPFDHYRELLTHPSSYAETQALGSALRATGVQAIQYRSARDKCQLGINVALFQPAALVSRNPLEPERWMCSTDGDKVVFRKSAGGEMVRFAVEDFRVAGQLPRPA